MLLIQASLFLVSIPRWKAVINKAILTKEQCCCKLKKAPVWKCLNTVCIQTVLSFVVQNEICTDKSINIKTLYVKSFLTVSLCEISDCETMTSKPIDRWVGASDGLARCRYKSWSVEHWIWSYRLYSSGVRQGTRVGERILKSSAGRMWGKQITLRSKREFHFRSQLTLPFSASVLKPNFDLGFC